MNVDERTKDILRRAGYWVGSSSTPEATLGVVQLSKMKEHLEQMQEGMRRVGMRPSPVYQYVIDHGVAFEKIPLTLGEMKIVDTIRGELAPKAGECFGNAMMAWAMDSRLKYCEGFCSAIEEKIIVPTYHAWNYLNGKLVDLTLPRKYHYWGVVFPDKVTERYVKRAFREREYTAILDDYVHDWEFLHERGYI